MENKNKLSSKEQDRIYICRKKGRKTEKLDEKRKNKWENC